MARALALAAVPRLPSLIEHHVRRLEVAVHLRQGASERECVCKGACPDRPRARMCGASSSVQG
eukprot:409097-Pleurochrysis_carterae.AAC.1